MSLRQNLDASLQNIESYTIQISRMLFYITKQLGPEYDYFFCYDVLNLKLRQRMIKWYIVL